MSRRPLLLFLSDNPGIESIAAVCERERERRERHCRERYESASELIEPGHLK